MYGKHEKSVGKMIKTANPTPTLTISSDDTNLFWYLYPEARPWGEPSQESALVKTVFTELVASPEQYLEASTVDFLHVGSSQDWVVDVDITDEGEIFVSRVAFHVRFTNSLKAFSRLLAEILEVGLLSFQDLLRYSC